MISISSQQQDPARIVHCSRRNGMEREAFKRQPLVRLSPCPPLSLHRASRDSSGDHDPRFSLWK